jgi:putative FmdB family regulatory protein
MASGIFTAMPIYDYRCSKCGHSFEQLVKPDEKPPCPKCGAKKAERLFSPNATVSTDKTRRRSLAQARTKAGAVKKEKDAAHQEYMRKEMSEHH